jgi:putative transposase
MFEALWARMQVELLNRRRWKTRIELATAIHEYIEHFHNTRRRHSALGMRTPAEVEASWLRQNPQRGLARPAPTAGEVQPLAVGLSHP